MIRPTPPSGFAITCERCRTEAPLAAITFDAAFAEARGKDWLDMARAGKKRERWPWLCPSCRPKGRSGLGGST
jgi:hypothetical protein